MTLQPVPRLLDVFRCVIVRENVPEVILRKTALSRNAVFKCVEDIAMLGEIHAKNEFFILRHECEHFSQVFLAKPWLLDLRVELRRSPENRRTLRSKLYSPSKAVFGIFHESHAQQRFADIAPSIG